MHWYTSRSAVDHRGCASSVVVRDPMESRGFTPCASLALPMDGSLC